MEFNIAEKLAIVKDIDRVILADNKVENGEMEYLGQLMKLLQFDSEFVEEARKFNIQQANGILQNMSEAKKHSLAIMLHEMAYADGDMAKEELKLLFNVFENVGIKIEKPGNALDVFDISDVYFKSSKQVVYYKNDGISESNFGVNRAIKIEPHIQGGKGFSVTVFNIDGINFLWGKKIEIPARQMEVFELGKDKTILRGYDERNNTAEKHSDYSLSIFHTSEEIQKIVFHHHPKNKVTEYLK